MVIGDFSAADDAMDQDAISRKTSAAIAGPPWMRRMRGLTDHAPYSGNDHAHKEEHLQLKGKGGFRLDQ